jgi:hypothetical protein
LPVLFVCLRVCAEPLWGLRDCVSVSNEEFSVSMYVYRTVQYEYYVGRFCREFSVFGGTRLARSPKRFGFGVGPNKKATSHGFLAMFFVVSWFPRDVFCGSEFPQGFGLNPKDPTSCGCQLIGQSKCSIPLGHESSSRYLPCRSAIFCFCFGRCWEHWITFQIRTSLFCFNYIISSPTRLVPMKLSTAAVVVSLAALASPSHAFAPLAMNKQNKRHQQGRMVVLAPLFLWVDQFSTPLVPLSSSSSLEARIKDCLTKGSNVEDMAMLLSELEDLLNACTEEGNQTEDECDVIMKDQRDVWIKALEDRISSTVATKSTAASLEEQVKAYDDKDSKLTLQDLKTLLAKLEAKHYECTEEGNQTLDECDLTVKADREHWIKKLEHAIQNPSLQQIEASLEQGNCGLSELTHLSAVIEHQTNLCTEEGHQTSDACDLAQKEQRAELMQVLEGQILKTQAQTAQQTRHCMTYQLCNTQALSKTLHGLEELSNLCTEEGNQTRSFCNLEAKQETEDVMERIRHQLELAETALMKEVVFQI